LTEKSLERTSKQLATMGSTAMTFSLKKNNATIKRRRLEKEQTIKSK